MVELEDAGAEDGGEHEGVEFFDIGGDGEVEFGFPAEADEEDGGDEHLEEAAEDYGGDHGVDDEGIVTFVDELGVEDGEDEDGV